MSIAASSPTFLCFHSSGILLNLNFQEKRCYQERDCSGEKRRRTQSCIIVTLHQVAYTGFHNRASGHEIGLEAEPIEQSELFVTSGPTEA